MPSRVDHAAMRAMVLDEPGRPLRRASCPSPRRPQPARRGARRGPRLRRLPDRPAHRDGEVRGASCPSMLGHQIVATVLAAGPRRPARARRARGRSRGWAGPAARAATARSGRENLCERAQFTGLDRRRRLRRARGGRRALLPSPLPDGFGDLEAAPLLCAGLIGHRALRMAGDARAPRPLRLRRRRAHRLPGRPAPGPRASSRSRAPGDEAAQAFALRARREWAGDATARPRGARRGDHLRPGRRARARALRAVGRGGVVVCGGIHMSDIPSFPYEILWGERVLRSVANLTRADGAEFLDLAPRVPVRTHVTTYALGGARGRARRPARRRDRRRGGARSPRSALLETDRLGKRHVDGGHPVGMDRPRAVTDVEEAAVEAPLCLVRIAA